MRGFTPISFLLSISVATSLAAAPEETVSAPVMVVAPGSAVTLEPAAPGDRPEVALGGGLLTAAKEVRAPAGGDHWLAVVSRDAVGNVSPVRWIRLRVDAEAPEVTLDVAPPPVPDNEGRPWVPETAKVQARATDAVAGLARVGLRAEGQAIEGDGSDALTLPLGPDGSCAAWAVDRVGNRSAEKTLTLNVDARPPSGRIRVVGPQVSATDRLVVGPEATLRLEHEDGESGVAGWTGAVDGREVDPETWAGPWPAGRHRADAEIVDRVGHRAPVDSLVFEVDAEAPTISWAVEDEGARDDEGRLVFRPPVSVRVDARDAAAGLAELASSEESGRWEVFSGRLRTSAGSVRLRARDRVGNVAETEASWRLDAEAPRLLVDGEELDPAAPPLALERTAGESLRITARDEGSGVDEITLSLDGGPWRPAPDVIRFLYPGRHRLAVAATDRLGNRRRVEWDLRVGKASR